MNKIRKVPTVVVVLTVDGIERTLILANEDDVDGQSDAYQLLARISAQLALLDNALRLGVQGGKS